MRFNLRQKLLVQHRDRDPTNNKETQYCHGERDYGGGVSCLIPRRLPRTTQHNNARKPDSSESSGILDVDPAHHHHHQPDGSDTDRCSDESKEDVHISDQRSNWDWKALEAEELRRRAMAPEVDGVVVPSYDPYSYQQSATETISSVRHTPSALDDVIRKVALLRTPLNYDDPEETSPQQQRKWLQAVIETIELSRISDMVLQEVDDCIREPAPDDVAAWEQRNYLYGYGYQKETPAPPDASIVALADSKDAGGSWLIQQDGGGDPPDNGTGTLRMQRMEFSNLSPTLTCDALSTVVVPTATTRCYGGGGGGDVNHNDVSAQVDGILDILEETSLEDNRGDVEEGKQRHPSLDRRTTSMDDDISVSSMEYLFNWLTCTEMEEVLASKKCIGEKAVETVKSDERQSKATRLPSPRTKSHQKGQAVRKKNKSTPEGSKQPRGGRSKSPLKRFTNRAVDASRARSSPKVKRHFLEKSSSPPHSPSHRHLQLGRIRSTHPERGQANVDLTHVSLPSLDGGSDDAELIRFETEKPKNSSKRHTPKIYPEAPRFQSLRRGGDGRKAERPSSNMRSNRNLLRTPKQIHA